MNIHNTNKGFLSKVNEYCDLKKETEGSISWPELNNLLRPIFKAPKERIKVCEASCEKREDGLWYIQAEDGRMMICSDEGKEALERLVDDKK